MSIGSAVFFAQLTRVPKTQTDTDYATCDTSAVTIGRIHSMHAMRPNNNNNNNNNDVLTSSTAVLIPA